MCNLGNKNVQFYVKRVRIPAFKCGNWLNAADKRTKPFNFRDDWIFRKGDKNAIKEFDSGGITGCLFFFVMVLATCQGLQTTAAAQDRIPLHQGGHHAGSGQSSDVSLEYQYVAQPGSFKLNIGGKAKRGDDQLSVWILLFANSRPPPDSFRAPRFFYNFT